MVTFTDDQVAEVLRWLILQEEAGYTLKDVIESIEDGSASKNLSFASANLSGLSEKV